MGQLLGVEGGDFSGEMRVVMMSGNGELWFLCGEEEVKEISKCWWWLLVALGIVKKPFLSILKENSCGFLILVVQSVCFVG